MATTETTGGTAKPVEFHWDRILSFGAALIAIAFYVGHSALQEVLAIRYGFQASPLATFTYDELLMHGSAVLLEIVAPRIVPGVLLSCLVIRLLDERPRRILTSILALPMAMLAIATPLTPLTPVMAALVGDHSEVLSKLLLIGTAVVIGEFMFDNFLLGAKPQFRLAVLISWLAFITWFIPILVAPDYEPFPTARVILADGGSVSGELLAKNGDFTVVGDRVAHRCLMIASLSVARIVSPEPEESSIP